MLDIPPKWTEENVLLLRTLWNEGFSASLIAARIEGFTRNAVVGKIHRLRDRDPSFISRDFTTHRVRANKPRAPRVARQTPSIAPLATDLPQVPPLKALPLMTSKPKPPAVPAPASRVSIMQLDSSTCRWPIGDVGHPDFCFCGSMPKQHSSYCEFHADIARQPSKPRGLGYIALRHPGGRGR